MHDVLPRSAHPLVSVTFMNVQPRKASVHFPSVVAIELASVYL